MSTSDKAVRRVADRDETESDMWGEVSALQAGAKELFKKALRAHEAVCDAAAEKDADEQRIGREDQQKKLDHVLWQATALLDIATDMVAEHYSNHGGAK